MIGARKVPVPADCGVILLANFDPHEPGHHRWRLDIFDASRAALLRPARLSYGSQIGGTDVDQKVVIAAHGAASVFRISAEHEEVDGWFSDASAVEVDTPACLGLTFSWPRRAAPWRLTLQFRPAANTAS